MYSDMTKWMNPEEMAKMFQTSWNMQDAIESGKQNMEVVQKANSVLAETMSTCFERQVQMMQNSMQESVEAVKELTTAGSIEDLMNKQSVLARKTAEQAQMNGQELAQLIQKGQTKVMDMLSNQVMQNLQSTVQTPKNSK